MKLVWFLVTKTFVPVTNNVVEFFLIHLLYGWVQITVTFNVFKLDAITIWPGRLDGELYFFFKWDSCQKDIWLLQKIFLFEKGWKLYKRYYSSIECSQKIESSWNHLTLAKKDLCLRSPCFIQGDWFQVSPP